ncbi:hypothetical protein [Fluviicola sp.]|jgi:hypothetical protein|uniref:hypothetical protein n=1 Tax=Fluviicola sp. TaxID=1917219 RepID=UPI00281905EC|nr:hypothetical protein [Fluviicola sp.]MDR0803250.1 hypothetical protein [Fluviicola sp.]
MATKKIESFKSSKFDLKESQVMGGISYGDYYGTTNGRKDSSGTADEARMTYNAPNMIQPNSGQDDLVWCLQPI